MTHLVPVRIRSARWGLTVALVCVLLTAGSVRADVTTCRSKLQTEVDRLHTALSAAMKTCKTKIGAERAKGALSGLGTNCKPGGGCLVTAAHACEAALKPVYDAANTKPHTSKVAVFRKNIEKLRQGRCVSGGAPCNADAQCPAVAGKNACTAVCTDEVLAVKLKRDGTSLGHLISGALGYAPPSTGSCDLDGDGKADPNCAAKFMIDHLLFATESLTIRRQLATDPDTLALFHDALAAISGGTTLAKSGVAGSAVSATAEFLPNLSRFGTECHVHSCQIDTTGTCSDNTTCDMRDTSGRCLDASPCDTNDPHACNDHLDQCAPTACGGAGCEPDKSFVRMTGAGLLITIPVLGGFNVEVCEGSAFNVEPNFLYLINQPDKTLTALIPPVLSNAIAGACVQIVRSEGWCDCTGAGLPKDFSLCQDHFPSGSGTDACGTAIDPTNLDSTYKGTVDGTATLTPSGVSAAGDCVDLVSMQFSLILDRSELGPDGLPCTADDLTVPAPPFSIPLTTGTSSVQLFDGFSEAGSCQKSGHCSVDTTQVCDRSAAPGTCPVGFCKGDPCIQDINCRQASFATDTCVDPQFLPPFSLTLSGAKTSCDNYRASNLGGFALTGAIPTLQIPFDMITGFRFACK